ncbi:unnamed protein product [marine sediment metagenome]|uniref:Uncharacterized protein n=1 Tax=marine sediment metagenome TaxID=412755 RepID=X1GDN6_9ZZZZ
MKQSSIKFNENINVKNCKVFSTGKEIKECYSLKKENPNRGELCTYSCGTKKFCPASPEAYLWENKQKD